MKITLIFLFNILTYLLFQQIDISALKKDPVLMEYKKVMRELMNATASRRYQLPRDPNIMKEFAKNPTKENMKKLYKDAGMKNADEYVDKIFLQTTYIE